MWGPGRRSIYQNGTCSISPRMAAKHPRNLDRTRPTNGWSFGKGKNADGKITMGENGFGCLRVSFPHCAPTREKCTLIFRNNADERRNFTDRLKRRTVKYFHPSYPFPRTIQKKSSRRGSSFIIINLARGSYQFRKTRKIMPTIDHWIGHQFYA